MRRLGRNQNSNRGVMEGAPLTQEGVCQAYQLIQFLNKEKSKKFSFIIKFNNYFDLIKNYIIT